ncbi:MAG: DUF2318 domain-containing protein [Theionarchaea archaeon]|nr:DUF2318 domain-containing protein [Theionarchaea archaeon]
METDTEKKKENLTSRKPLKYFLGMGICLGLVLIVVYGMPESELSSTTDEAVRISLSDLSETARWYGYDAGGITVKYFAVRAGDGSIKTGLDACDVCFRLRKGYSQTGPYMICNNCGNRYEISGLGSKNRNPGGCWPGYLPSSVEGEYLIIRKQDLEERRDTFA